jgi:hypothetical protein
MFSKLRRDSRIEQLVKFNTHFHPKKKTSDEQALFELGMFNQIFLAYGCISEIMAKEQIECIGYRPDNLLSLREKIIFKILSNSPLDNGRYFPFRILKSLGIRRFVLPKLFQNNSKISKAIPESIIGGSRINLLNLEIDGIKVGDLFYDWHLRSRELATVDTASREFIKDLEYFIRLSGWWIDYFRNNNVRFVFTSHAVYIQGLVGRIGLKFNAKVFVVGDERINQLSPLKINQDTEFREYDPKYIEQYSYKIDYLRSSTYLKQLKAGKSADIAHSVVTGFLGSRTDTIIKANKVVRILIAAHCFSDAPHSSGDMLFSDFWCWLEFLSKRSKSHPKYEWYIKEHPGFFESDKRIFKEFCEENPQITPISAAFSNPQLFTQGVNAVLTVHGTIAFEAASLGVLSINASLNCPHVNYSFSRVPKSIDELEGEISNLEESIRNFQPEHNEILHFYDLHHLRRNNSWLYRNKLEEMLAFSGGYQERMTGSDIYGFWIEHYSNTNRRNLILEDLTKYLLSDDYLFEWTRVFS